MYLFEGMIASTFSHAKAAKVLGVDENHQVPVLVGEGAELAIQDAA